MEINRLIPKFLMVAVAVVVFILVGIAPAQRTAWIIVSPQVYEASKNVPWLVTLRDSSSSFSSVSWVRYKAYGCPRWEIGMRNEQLESMGLPRMY